MLILNIGREGNTHPLQIIAALKTISSSCFVFNIFTRTTHSSLPSIDFFNRTDSTLVSNYDIISFLIIKNFQVFINNVYFSLLECILINQNVSRNFASKFELPDASRSKALLRSISGNRENS